MGVVNRSARRDEVWLVPLDPAQGAEIQKTRPCLIISPDQMNKTLDTVVIAPMTTVERSYPSRVAVLFHGKRGQVALDQLRAVDHGRLIRKHGTLPAKAVEAVSAVLVEMFTRA